MAILGGNVNSVRANEPAAKCGGYEASFSFGRSLRNYLILYLIERRWANTELKYKISTIVLVF